MTSTNVSMFHAVNALGVSTFVVEELVNVAFSVQILCTLQYLV